MLPIDTRPGFPKVWTVCGYVVLLLLAIFVGRIVFEETTLTWAFGPQMIGFAMAHTMPFMMFSGLIGLVGGLLWMLVSLVLAYRRRFRILMIDWFPMVLLPLLGVVLFIPYEAWEELMMRALGRSAHGGEFLVQAAGADKRRFVSLLLRQGYDVNYQDSGGSTPLSAASVEGRPDMVSFLISRGADVNRKNGLAGESALMGAAEMGQLATVRVLLNSGAEPCALDKEGHTAEGLARKFNHGEIANYLSSRFHCKEDIVTCSDSNGSICVNASEAPSVR